MDKGFSFCSPLYIMDVVGWMLLDVVGWVLLDVVGWMLLDVVGWMLLDVIGCNNHIVADVSHILMSQDVTVIS